MLLHPLCKVDLVEVVKLNNAMPPFRILLCLHVPLIGRVVYGGNVVMLNLIEEGHDERKVAGLLQVLSIALSCTGCSSM